jgi:phosphoribosyl-ATP pyrophosphohydrolase
MNNEIEIASINHNVSCFVEQQKRHNERLRRRGWCKWTTIKRVRNLMLEVLNHACGDRDNYIRNFIDRYYYHGYVVVTELELGENSKPALVKELHDYCQNELKKLKDVEKQKKKDIRRLKTINKRRVKRGLKPFKHLPVYNRTRDSRNHARNVRRNLIASKIEEEQMQVLDGQQKESIDRMIDEAFDLKHYLLPLPEMQEKTPFDWSSLLSTTETHNH